MRRNLATLDRDILQAHGRIIQEAFAHGIENDMIFGGLMAGQSAVQGLFADPVAIQNCRWATRRVTWDGQVFRYAQATATLDPHFLSYTLNHIQEMAWAATAGAAKGATAIAFTVGAGDGDGSGNVAVDKLKDGHVWIWGGSTVTANMRIVSNTLGASAGSMTLTLEAGLPQIVPNTAHGEACACPWKDVQGAGGGGNNFSYIGLPTVIATAALPGHWTQTWGMCCFNPANGFGTVDPGASANNNQIVAFGGGSMGAHDDDVATLEYQQHIGYIMSRSQALGQGAPFVMLQICP